MVFFLKLWEKKLGTISSRKTLPHFLMSSNHCLFQFIQLFHTNICNSLNFKKHNIDDKYHAIKVLNLYKNTLQFNTYLLQIKIHI